MDKKCQQLFKGKRIEFPLATGATSHVSLVYDEQKNPYLLCFTSMHEEKAEFTVPLNGCRIINNITEIGPCIHIITAYEEYQFQCISKEEFNDMSQFFNTLGFPILGFKNVYVLNKKIGKGSFSTAYIGTNTLYGNRVVIKEVDKSKVKESNVYTEIEVLRKVMHKYVIKLISAYEQEGYVYLVLEYLKGGELFEYLNNHGPYSEEDAKKAMRRILIALGALHSNGVVHRDLKMENLMLENPNDPCSLKIIDFGLASFLNTSSMNMRCGSPGYVAPEILKYAPYGTKVDIFSLGVILFNILCGYPPFRGSNVKEIFRKNVRCNISFNTKHWLDKSNSVKEIISWMCCKNPDNRCTAIQALGHPWFLPKLTDMYMMKAVEDVKPKDNSSTLVSENSSTKTSNSSNNSSTITKAADTQYHLLKQQDLYKKNKNNNAEKGNYNNNNNNNNHENDTKENDNGKTYDNLQNKKMNLKNYKTYFDTLLKTDDKHCDIKVGAKNNADDHAVHTYNKKNMDGYIKSEIEHEKLTLQGKSIVPSSNCSSSLIPNVTTKKRDVQRVTSHKNIRNKSDEKLKKIIKEEIVNGRNSVDAKRYAAKF